MIAEGRHLFSCTVVWNSVEAVMNVFQRFQVVYPVLPMDLLGVYVLLPE